MNKVSNTETELKKRSLSKRLVHGKTMVIVYQDKTLTKNFPVLRSRDIINQK